MRYLFLLILLTGCGSEPLRRGFENSYEDLSGRRQTPIEQCFNRLLDRNVEPLRAETACRRLYEKDNKGEYENEGSLFRERDYDNYWGD